MTPWPPNPLVYEINTWVWLGEFARRADRPLTLAEVPDEALDAVADLGFHAVWLMGVWERSPAGVAVALGNPGLRAEFRRTLPDFAPADAVGSPYCVRRYRADDRLGGPEALAALRDKLDRRGLRLILDFVPNHVAFDHPWVTKHPEYFIQGTAEDLRRDPSSFVRLGDVVFARGRDPYFPAWADVLQLDAFSPGLRGAARATLADMAGQCDGVRCDMAMLLIEEVFRSTWSHHVGDPPPKDYWREIIPAVKRDRPDFLFLAEAYWDLEWELQQQGFDFCYDKRLYDRLEHGTAQEVRLHLLAEMDYQEKLVRFIENHDEPRAQAVFGPKRHRLAAVAALTLPGAALVHEGQLEGRRVRLPVFLGRRPAEIPDPDLPGFYRALLTTLARGRFKTGQWLTFPCKGWSDNPSHANLAAWGWLTGESRCLVVVNLGSAQAQGRVTDLWPDIAGSAWRLRETGSDMVYDRQGDAMLADGLYVDLPPNGYHFLVWERA